MIKPSKSVKFIELFNKISVSEGARVGWIDPVYDEHIIDKLLTIHDAELQGIIEKLFESLKNLVIYSGCLKDDPDQDHPCGTCLTCQANNLLMEIDKNG